MEFQRVMFFREEFEEDDSEVEDSEEEQEDMEDYKKGAFFYRVWYFSELTDQ